MGLALGQRCVALPPPLHSSDCFFVSGWTRGHLLMPSLPGGPASGHRELFPVGAYVLPTGASRALRAHPSPVPQPCNQPLSGTGVPLSGE